MKTYQFTTTATMKLYNNKKWWIASDLIPRINLDADNLKAALEQYKAIVQEKHGVEISNHAMKTKNPMYVDTKSGETKQIGFVITGKTDFNDNNRRWVSNYIDLWIRIDVIHNVFEEEEN